MVSAINRRQVQVWRGVWRALPLGLLVVIVMLIAVLRFHALRIDGVSLTYHPPIAVSDTQTQPPPPPAVTREAELPYLEKLQSADNQWSMAFNLAHAPYRSTNVRIASGMCPLALSVNGVDYPLARAIERVGNRCDRWKGVALNLDHFLRSGDNAIEVQLAAYGGEARLFFASDPLPWLMPQSWMALALVALVVSLLLRMPLAQRHFNVGYGVLFAASIALMVYAFDQTNMHDRSNDVEGHLEYMRMIMEKGVVPPAYVAWQTYQPPFYHLLSIPFLTLGEWLGFSVPADGIRMLSLIICTAALFYAFALFDLLIRRPWLRNLAATTVAVWPILLQAVGKINNDMAIYLLALMCLYHLARWQKTFAVHELAHASLIAVIAVGVKSTAYPLLATVALTATYYWVRRRVAFRQCLPSRYYLFVLVMAGVIAAIGNQGRLMYYRMQQEKPVHNFVVGNLSDHGYQGWGSYLPDDRWQDYVTLSLPALIDPPVPFEGANNPSRRYFWNTVIKSTLLGVGGWKYMNVAQAVLITYLLLLAYSLMTLFAAAIRRQAMVLELAPMLLLSGMCFAVMLYFRTRYPTTGFGDARYIFFTVPILSLMFCRSIEWHLDMRRLLAAGAGVVLVMNFIFLSVLLTALQ